MDELVKKNPKIFDKNIELIYEFGYNNDRK